MIELIAKLNGLWKYTKKGRRKIIPAVVMMIIGSILFATIPVIARNYIDSLFQPSGEYCHIIVSVDGVMAYAFDTSATAISNPNVVVST